MDERDSNSQKIDELDRLADQVLGPIDHVRQYCAWTDRRKSEDYVKILKKAAAKAAEQYVGKKEGIPPHVRSAARSKVDRGWLKRLLEGLIGVILLVLASTRRCAAAIVGPGQQAGLATLGLLACIGTMVVINIRMTFARPVRGTDAVHVTHNTPILIGMEASVEPELYLNPDLPIITPETTVTFEQPSIPAGLSGSIPWFLADDSAVRAENARIDMFYQPPGLGAVPLSGPKEIVPITAAPEPGTGFPTSVGIGAGALGLLRLRRAKAVS